MEGQVGPLEDPEASKVITYRDMLLKPVVTVHSGMRSGSGSGLRSGSGRFAGGGAGRDDRT